MVVCPEIYGALLIDCAASGQHGAEAACARLYDTCQPKQAAFNAHGMRDGIAPPRYHAGAAPRRASLAIDEAASA